MKAFIIVFFYDSRAHEDMPDAWRKALTLAHQQYSPAYPHLEHVTCLYQWDKTSPLCIVDIALDGTACFIANHTQILWDMLYRSAVVSVGMYCRQIGESFEEFYQSTQNRWTISRLALRHLRRGTYTKDTVSCTSFARLCLPELGRDAFTAGGLYKEMLEVANAV